MQARKSLRQWRKEGRNVKKSRKQESKKKKKPVRKRNERVCSAARNKKEKERIKLLPFTFCVTIEFSTVFFTSFVTVG